MTVSVKTMADYIAAGETPSVHPLDLVKSTFNTMAPVYDMLPMRYAPQRGGEVPPQTYAPALPLPTEALEWHRAALAAVARVTGRIVQLPAHDAAEIENHLAALRIAGVDVQDMEIRRPDLEDVFLQVMSGTSASNIRLEGVAI